MDSKKYFKHLDILRIVGCISVLLFHLGILKGGYLAVCLFFTLSSYLGCIKNYKKEHFNIFKYYKDKIINIYIPVVLVLLCTVFVSKYFDHIAWLNLKLEVKSVLLNYNNYWQISTNVDYFTKSINSPLTHLWYISMFIQYELIFPFVFLFFKKVGKKISEGLSVFVLSTMSILLTLYFIYITLNKGLMISYYDSIARSYSYIYGLTLGFIHVFFGVPVIKPFRNKIVSHIIYYLMIICLLVMFIFIDSGSVLFIPGMILTSLLTLRLIDYSVILSDSCFSKVIKYIASISYEVYLIQYPVIYYVYVLDLKNKYLIIISITLVLSIILSFIFDKNFKHIIFKIFRFLFFLGLVVISFFGARIFALESDNKEEMKMLEELLKQNEELVLNMSDEQMEKFEEADSEWEEKLKSLDEEEKELSSKVSKLKVTGIGDSVLLGAVSGLYKRFPNGYFDGKVSRTDCDLMSLLNEIDSKGKLYDTVVINLGTNGSCTKKTPEIMNRLKDKKIYWLTVVNDYQVPNVAKRIYEYPSIYSNVSLIDWKNISKDHKEYFYKDGIHLTSKGITGYSDAIYNAIYEDYKKEYDLKKENLLKEQELEKNKRITFIGNTTLIHLYPKLTEIENTNIISNKDYDFDTLKSDIEKYKEIGTLNKRLVFILDNSFKTSKSKLEELFSTLKDYDITFVSFNSSFDSFDNINTIKFYEDLKDEYFYKDKINLNEEGLEKLKSILITNLNE